MGIMKRILIVDDHAPFREALREFLSQEPDFQIVGAAGTLREAMLCAAALAPHMVLTDLSMPDAHGVDAVTEIRRLQPKVKILVVSLHREGEYKRVCRRAGADGYVVKDAIVQELCDCIRAIFGVRTGPGATDAVSKYLPGSTALIEARDNFRH